MIRHIHSTTLLVPDQDNPLSFNVGSLGWGKRADSPLSALEGVGSRCSGVGPPGAATVLALLRPEDVGTLPVATGTGNGVSPVARFSEPRTKRSRKRASGSKVSLIRCWGPDGYGVPQSRREPVLSDAGTVGAVQSTLDLYDPLPVPLAGGWTPLSAEEEQNFARRAHAGERGARQRLIEGNLGLVVYKAKRYRGLGMPFEDLIQEGNV